MVIKAILFDIDNTLIDFMQMKRKSCEAAVDAMIGAGLKVKKEEVLKTLYELYDKYGIEYQQIFQKLLKKLEGKIDYKIIASGVIAYRKVREFYLVLYPDVIPILINLKKKYKLAVISDAPTLQAWTRLITMKIDPFFDVVITKGDVKKQKTYPTPFKVTLKKLKVKPEESLMLGDRIERDVNTAKKLGIKTCFARYGVENPPKHGKSGADFEINNFSEILKVMEKLK
ncbi:MAG: TIGR02253 family HAD-type hydrolase [Nanoarchaeota archaeon]|nr:TIGR02253 family HAD-type hydrolase [Nanoarchaeota archaeon]